MFGCCSRAASAISRLKRSVETVAAISGGSTLITTLRPSAALRRRKDARHATATELALDGVGAAERFLESGLELHQWPRVGNDAQRYDDAGRTALSDRRLCSPSRIGTGRRARTANRIFTDPSSGCLEVVRGSALLDGTSREDTAHSRNRFHLDGAGRVLARQRAARSAGAPVGRDRPTPSSSTASRPPRCRCEPSTAGRLGVRVVVVGGLLVALVFVGRFDSLVRRWWIRFWWRCRLRWSLAGL